MSFEDFDFCEVELEDVRTAASVGVTASGCCSDSILS